MIRRNRRLIIIVGQPRSGKSHLAEQMLEGFLAEGNSALIYNASNKADEKGKQNFANATTIELLGEREHEKILQKYGKNYLQEWQRYPEFLYFADENKKTQKFKEFSSLYFGRAAKTFLLKEQKMETAFFSTFFDYTANCCLVLDDAKEMFRYGLNADFIRLFSKINHSGQKSIYQNYKAQGVDVVVIMHDISNINPAFLPYVTDIIYFKTTSEPVLNAKNQILENTLREAYEFTSTAPKYSYCVINTDSPEILQSPFF